LEAIFAPKDVSGPPPPEPAEPTEAPPPPEAAPTEQPPEGEGPEMDIEPTIVPQYIPVPVVMPAGYGFRFPGYARNQICRAEFGGSCNSECRNGPTRHCLDCVYFCGQPRYKNYDYSNPRRPKFYVKPRRGVFPRPNCGGGRHWDARIGKCVRDAGGPGPFPGDRDCPRGSRFDWSKKKCVQVPQPTPRPDDDDNGRPPTTPKPPTTPPAPTPPVPPAPEGDRKRREETRQKIVKKIKERKTPAPSGGTPAVTSTYTRSYYGNSGCGCGGGGY
jgi:hypothetical protein